RRRLRRDAARGPCRGLRAHFGLRQGAPPGGSGRRAGRRCLLACPGDHLEHRHHHGCCPGEGRPGRRSPREPRSGVRHRLLRVVQQKKVAWAPISLSEILRDSGCPQEAFDVLEPLLGGIVNDELWLQALLCEGEAPPRGLGARERVMAQWRRYERRLRDLGLYPSAASERTYKRLLMTDSASGTGHADTLADVRLGPNDNEAAARRPMDPHYHLLLDAATMGLTQDTTSPDLARVGEGFQA